MIYDVTTNNNGTTFASLSSLLSDENLSTLIPSSVRCGGMSIRFVKSSDNKYVQYRLITTSFSTTESDWQGVNEKLMDDSDNLITNGGIKKVIDYTNSIFSKGLQNIITKGDEISISQTYIEKYININGRLIEAISWVTNEYIIPENTRFVIISGRCSSIGALFVFHDSDGNVLEKPSVIETKQFYTDLLVTVPFGAYSILINYQTISEPSYTASFNAFAYNQDVLISLLDKKIERLKGKGTHWSQISNNYWQVGEKMYNTQTGVINRCFAITNDGGVQSWENSSEYPHVPEKEAIYIIDHSVYTYNGSTLIDPVMDGYDIPTIIVEQKTINAGGEIYYDEKRIATVTKFISSESEVKFKMSNAQYGIRIFEFDSSDTLVKYTTIYDNVGTNDAIFYMDDNQNDYLRLVFLHSDGTDISVNEFDSIGLKYDEEKISIDTFKHINSLGERVSVLEQKQYDDVPICNLSNKKVAFLGDSITASGSPSDPANMYHQVFARLSGCQVKNLGQWNTTIARDVDNLTPTAQPFITRVTQENLSDCDMIVIFGGINDYAHDNLPIGNLFEDEIINGKTVKVANSDTNCFAGAIHELINTIRSIIPLAPIVFMTPLQGVRDSDLRTNDRPNRNGDMLEDFRNAINEICAFYMVPVFNIDKIFNFDPHNETHRTTYYADGLHPNDAGHIYIGKLLYKFVMNNIAI